MEVITKGQPEESNGQQPEENSGQRPEEGNGQQPEENNEQQQPVGQSQKIPTWVELLMILGVFLLASFFGGVLKVMLQSKAGVTPEFGTFISYVTSMGLTVIFAISIRLYQGHKRPLLRFTLKKTNPSLILWGFLLVFAVSTVIEPLIELFPSSYLEVLYAAVGRGGWTMLTLIVAAPILEEILFRGVIQEFTTRKHGKLWGVLIASALFGVIHIIPQQVVAAFFIGIILGYIYIKTQSLVAVIVIHAMNNALAYIMMVVFDNLAITTRTMMGNDTLYWVVYGSCLVLTVVAVVAIWRSVKTTTEKPEVEEQINT